MNMQMYNIYKVKAKGRPICPGLAEWPGNRNLQFQAGNHHKNVPPAQLCNTGPLEYWDLYSKSWHSRGRRRRVHLCEISILKSRSSSLYYSLKKTTQHETRSIVQ